MAAQGEAEATGQITIYILGSKMVVVLPISELLKKMFVMLPSCSLVVWVLFFIIIFHF
uniref:Uncharacterized protein n=1 Tax=Rhizophora mucronata TaxID=61149 RepID=A0A2P2N4G6_RHIMU